jgi:hypothetical protein
VNQIVRVKFLYRAALDQWESGHPFAAGMAISLLQDAVEAMAHDAAASLGASARAGAGLLDYWDAVAKSQSGKVLPYKIEMAALNAARVGFKHHGAEHAPAEVEKHVLAAHRFLQEAALQFFGVDFDGLSEADLISAEGVRIALKAAEEALTRDDVKGTLERSRDALDVLQALLKKTVPVAEEDPFGPPIPLELRKAAEGVVRWLNRRFSALEMAVSLSVLGMNPADFWFLSGTLPYRNYAGVYHWLSPNPIQTQTADRAQTCIRIIINMALRLDRLRANLQRLEGRAGLAEEQRRQKEWQDRLLNQVTIEAAKPQSRD